MAFNHTIQGNSAVLFFMKDDWVEFGCFSEVSVEISADTESVVTVGDGVWAKPSYKSLSYSVTLNGLVVFDDLKFNAWEMIQNQIGFTTVQFKIVYTDDSGTVKSIQGETIVEHSTFSLSVETLLEGDFNLVGFGAPMIYDGIEPCATSIDSISFDGLDSEDGVVTVTYDYTGPIYQVKYIVDGGAPSYALLGVDIVLTMGVGAHNIVLTPVCTNGYEGDSNESDFAVSLSLSCALAVDSIVITGTGPAITAAVTFNSTPGAASMRYSINGGAFTIFVGALSTTTNINLSLPIGSYTINVIPTCSNGADGTGLTQSFNVTTGSGIGTINYAWTNIPGGNSMLIYKNGLVVISLGNSNASGTITASNGDSIMTVVSTINTFDRAGSLSILNNTTSTSLFSDSYETTSTDQSGELTFTFTVVGGDTYSIAGEVTP